jgi:NAD(P)-dependent dehydrogenase (short-subunit alcohol dehydrogenase family)/acyl carrier protein
MLAPIIEPFLEQFHDLTLHSPGIPYVSNVTGTWITAEQATAPSYWAEHLRHTVRFAEGLHTVLQEPECLLLEVGPGHTLRTLARRHPARTPGQPVLASCPGRQDQASEAAWILRVLGQLWLAGVDVDWTGFSTLECRQRLALPSYPFERQRYWIEPHALTPPIVPRQPALARKPDIADWFYLPSWKRSMLPHARDARAAGQQTSCWIVFADACGLGERLVQRLQRQGHDVITVVQGEHFTRLGDTRYSLHPCRRDDYEALLQAVHNSEKRFSKIVHCWSITPEDAALAADAAFTQAQENGFYSVLFLAQALGERHNPEPLHIALVSNHLHDVAGGETLHPEKATLLGCCKVLPQEYPHLTCRSLDVVLPPVGSWQEAQLLEQMTAELCAPVEDAVVAYRGPHRWLQSFEPIRLSSPAARPSLLRDRGVYLITGGLGGIGLLLAAYLARTVQARLVLTGREGLPPRAAWEQLLAVNADADKQTDSAYAIHLELEKEISNFSRIEAEIASKLNIKDIEYYDNLKESLDTLCANYIYYYFKENNIDVKNCIIYHKDELKNILNISNKFDKFYEFMISELSKDHIISVIDNHIQFLTDNIMSPYDMKNNLDDIYPEFSGLFNLLDHCAKHYSAALRGDIEAISVLYPEGSTDLLREANENTIEHDNRRAYILLLQRILSRIIDSDKKIKILEIGGGAGRMTRDLISCLENKNIEYYFTDISKSFIVRAEQEAIKHNVKFMQFGILDISRDPEEQGYKNHSFDIVLALDVVHATSSIEKTLKNIKNLLTPNGLLCLIETVKARRWIDMIWGLAEGWWSFNDAHLRQNSPLLDLDTWEKVLQEQGFKCVQAFPQQATRRLATDYGLIMAQQQAERLLPHAPAGLTVRPQASAGLLRHQIRQVLQLEACGAEVLVCKADIANPQHMQACVRQACEHFGAIHGVIHTAAIAGGGLMQLQSPDLVQREFTPKVEGARLLTALFKPGQLDFLVFCSSLSSLTGGIGQVSYCAANAFLDALAHASTSRHDTYTVSINWDRWRQVGLAVAVEARHKALKGDEVDPEGMTAEEGVEAFHRLLSYQVVPQVVVSAEDFSAYLAQSRALRAEQALTTLIQDRPAVAVHPRPPLRQAYVAPRNEVEHRLADIWQAVFGIESVGMHDNFFELGGESLMALQLLNRLRTAFQVELSLKRFFEASTIAAVAEAIGHAGLSATVPAPAIVPLSREAYRSKRPS